MPRKLLIILAAVAVVIALIAAFLLLTRPGAELAVKTAGDMIALNDEFTYESFEGTLTVGLYIKGLEMRDPKDFPKGTILRVQDLYIKLNGLSLDGVEVECENARLLLPSSDPVVLRASVSAGQVDANLYSNGISVRELLTYLPELKVLSKYSGRTGLIDLYITGPIMEPRVTGGFLLEEFLYKGFKLTDSQWDVNVLVKGIPAKIDLNGEAAISSGTFHSSRVTVDVQNSKLRFAGSWKDPELYIRGKTRIERTDISISITGNIREPEILLTSVPSYSRQKLMVMLATGQAWQGVESSIETGTLNPNITGDFISYFLFADKKNAFAKKLGIKDLYFTIDEDTRGIEAKKGITKNLDVGFGVEQQISDDQDTTITHKLKGEYQVTDTVSVGVEREIKKTRSLDELDPAVESEEEDKVFLKYKKSF